MDFERVSLNQQHYLYVDRECPYGPEIATAMESAFGELFGFIGQTGITPLAPPMAVYMEMDPSILRFRGAVIVTAGDAARAQGSVKSDTLPAGDAMRVVHVGGYDEMSKTHQALWGHMETTGITGAMPVWEIYIDDPGDVPQERLRTEIFRAIA